MSYSINTADWNDSQKQLVNLAASREAMRARQQMPPRTRTGPRTVYTFVNGKITKTVKEAAR